MIFGVSEPVIIAVVLLIVIIVLYVIPEINKRRNVLDYSNFRVKDSNAYWHYAGSGPAPSYMNLQIQKAPIVHNNGRATVYLEGLPNPLVDVVIDENNENCNCVIKRTADALFGVRIDVLCNVDANSCKHSWDNVYVQNWDQYTKTFIDAAKQEVVRNTLDNKELLDEIRNTSQDTTTGALDQL
jgi:hypothetical protein